MKAENDNTDPVKAYICRLENPYASLSLTDQPEDPVALAPTLDRMRCYFRDLQDPHAQSEIFDEEQVRRAYGPQCAEPEPQQRLNHGRVSKTRFQAECRRILVQYIPPAEGRTLRPTYRDFISRNQDRSAEDRSRILEELKKYDLATTANLKPHFNRERQLFAAAKLRQIEEAIRK